MTIESVEKYGTVGTELIPLGNQQYILVNALNKTHEMLNSEEAEWVRHLRSNDTFENHVQMITQLSGYYDKALDRSKVFLKNLIKRKLLTSHTDICSYFNYRGAQQESKNRIATLSWVTKDRPQLLEESMNSYVKICLKYERDNTYLVVDGSESPLRRRDHRERLRDFGRRLGIEIDYIGFEEKADFIDLLGKKGIPPEVARFALTDTENLGHSTGANRNAVLLHTVGDLIFCADDDTECKLAPAPDQEDVLLFSQYPVSNEIWFFKNRSDALNSVKFADQDILGLHEMLLGQTIFQGMHKYLLKKNFDLRGFGSDVLQSYGVNKGKILATFNGSIGDCGWGYPGHCLFLQGNSRERLMKSLKDYQIGLQTREIIQATNATTITNSSGPFMSMFMGLDNREILPPFMPIMRAQDYLFCTTIHKCFEERFFAYFPWVGIHNPPSRMAFEIEDNWRMASVIRLNDILSGLIEIFKINSAHLPAEDNLKGLGRLFLDLGKLPVQDFIDFAKVHFWKGVSRQIRSIEQLLSTASHSPEFWSADVMKYIDILCTEVLQVPLPEDLKERGDREQVQKMVQRLIFKFGELLMTWPDIIRTTKDLRKEGIRIGRRL